MTELDQKLFPYKSGKTESSSAILIVRIAAGLPIGVVAGFIGSIFNIIVVPTRTAGDVPDHLAPLVVTGLFAASGVMIVWINRFESRRGIAFMWTMSTAGALLGAFIAYYFGDRYAPELDLHNLNKWVAQIVLLGASIGANTAAVLTATLAPKFNR
jgi:hypothetical protein